MKLFAAGAASLAVQACGGGGGGGASAGAPITSLPIGSGPIGDPNTPAPGTPDPAAVWTTIPDLVFTQGVPASISIAPFVTAPGVKAITLALNTSVTLPAGVTFNATTKSFNYDGVGAAATSPGHILTATV
jgi:hypothetical protein